MIRHVKFYFYHQTMMTRNQTKIVSATPASATPASATPAASAAVAAINPSLNTSNDPLVIDNNHAIIYPNMFDRWSLPL